MSHPDPAPESSFSPGLNHNRKEKYQPTSSPDLETYITLKDLPSQHTHLADSGTQEIKEGYHIEQFGTESPENKTGLEPLTRKSSPVTTGSTC